MVGYAGDECSCNACNKESALPVLPATVTTMAGTKIYPPIKTGQHIIRKRLTDGSILTLGRNTMEGALECARMLDDA